MRSYQVAWTVFIVALSMLAYGTPVRAHDEPEQTRSNIEGGIICDTLEQVKDYIHKPAMLSPGCGRLVGMRPATVTMLPDYIFNGLRFHMTQYEFNADVPWGVPIQFGFWGQPEPVVTPAKVTKINHAQQLVIGKTYPVTNWLVCRTEEAADDVMLGSQTSTEEYFIRLRTWERTPTADGYPTCGTARGQWAMVITELRYTLQVEDSDGEEITLWVVQAEFANTQHTVNFFSWTPLRVVTPEEAESDDGKKAEGWGGIKPT